MRTCYIDVSPKDVEHIVSQIKEQNPDGVIVLAPINPMNTYAQVKKEMFSELLSKRLFRQKLLQVKTV
jgi:RNase H-fold protein (predicted Holliday junction resolvase)